MIGKTMPLSFICSKVKLSWLDLLWGCEQGLIDYSDAVDLAVVRLTQGSDDPDVLEIAVTGKSNLHEVQNILQKLGDKCREKDEKDIKRKWLYLILSWLYENREEFSDPLEEIENIYADFDYPEEIEDFVRYMPVSDGYDPAQHRYKENRARLFGNWERYLFNMEREFGG